MPVNIVLGPVAGRTFRVHPRTAFYWSFVVGLVLFTASVVLAVMVNDPYRWTFWLGAGLGVLSGGPFVVMAATVRELVELADTLGEEVDDTPS